MRSALAAGLLGLGFIAPGAAAASDGALPVLTPAGREAPEEASRDEVPPADPSVPAELSGSLAHGPMKSLRKILDGHRGEPVLLTIWATWCAPCVKEIPVLNEAARRFRDSGLHVLGVSVDSLSADSDEAGISAVTRFLGEHRVSYPSFYYEGDANVLGDALGWTGVIPFSVLYDARGKIIERMPGAVSEGHLFSRLAELLRDSAAKPGR